MMKNLPLLIFLFILAGCSKFEIVSNDMISSSEPFIAVMENAMPSDNTKTYLDENIKLLWHGDDELTIFGSTLNERYEFDGETGDNSGTFSKIDSGDFGAGNPINRNYAIYPYDKENKIVNDESYITVPFPDVQNYEEGSIGIGANIATAVTENTSDRFLSFKNACSYYRMVIYGVEADRIRSVELKGRSGEKISGTAQITFNEEKIPLLTILDDEYASESIILDCGEEGAEIGTSKENGTVFWMVLPPRVFAEGVMFIITNTNGDQRTLELKTANLEFSRSLYKKVNIKFDQSLTVNINKEKERNALMALYNSLGGDGWRNNSNWCSESPVGEWYGVSVDEEGFVVGLDLSGNNLSGEIPEQIGDFSRLVNLDLGMVSVGKENFKNSITGSLPESICRLTQLESLDLSNNQLQGVLPENLGNLSKMRNLFLDNNQFTGAIPESIWTGMSQLYLCWLNDNGFTGGLTSSIGKCISLGELRIGNNNFSSSLPAEICNLKNLVVLELVNSGVTGSIPFRIGDMKSLQYLWASGNNLSGSIPESICNLSGLLELKLGSNSLRGTIPNLGLLGNVKVISLENNMLEGPIPETIGKCANLSKLDVSNNRITGSIPSAISYCKKLQILNAYSNRLDGDLPKTLGDCTELKQLRLNDNKLRGEIPASMGKMVKLVILHLNSNQLSGEVIDFSSMESLKQLLLDSNADLEGEISADVLNRLESYSIDGTKINIGSGGGLQNPETGGEDMPWE